MSNRSNGKINDNGKRRVSNDNGKMRMSGLSDSGNGISPGENNLYALSNRFECDDTSSLFFTTYSICIFLNRPLLMTSLMTSTDLWCENKAAVARKWGAPNSYKHQQQQQQTFRRIATGAHRRPSAEDYEEPHRWQPYIKQADETSTKHHFDAARGCSADVICTVHGARCTMMYSATKGQV